MSEGGELEGGGLGWGGGGGRIRGGVGLEVCVDWGKVKLG